MKSVTYSTHDEWLEARAVDHGIGASTVGAILGASSYRTPWDVWASHYAPDAIKAGNVAQLQRGHLLERHILRLYAEEQGIDVEHYDRTICYHDDQNWARFSPDGIRSDGGVVEVKTVRNGWEWRDAPVLLESGDELEYLPSLNYGLQCHWQMLVSGAPFVDLVVLPLGHELAAVADALAMSDWPEALGVIADAIRSSLVVVRVMRDSRFAARLGARVAEWREKHLVGGDEPMASGAHASAYHGRQPKKGSVEVDEASPITEVADALYHAKRRKKAIDAEVKDYTGRIKQAMQHVEEVRTERGIITWRKVGRGKAIDLRQWVYGGTTHTEAPIEPLHHEPPTAGDTDHG